MLYYDYPLELPTKLPSPDYVIRCQPYRSRAAGKDYQATVVLCLGKSKRDPSSHKMVHPQRVTIGKLIVVEGKQRFIPNERYFEFWPDPPPPNLAAVTGRGRPQHKRPQNTQPQPAAELHTGFRVAWHHALDQLGLAELMDQVWGAEQAHILQSLAAFYAFYGNEDLPLLEHFARTQLSEKLTPQAACDALAALTPDQQMAFCAQWAQRHAGSDLLLYHVPARTAESGPELAWSSWEPRTLCLFTCAQSALPLYYALDEPHVVDKARALGLTGYITMVGAADQAAVWHQQGFGVLSTVPASAESSSAPVTQCPYTLGELSGTLYRYQGDRLAFFTTEAGLEPELGLERYRAAAHYAQMVAQLKTEVWGDRLVVHSERVEQGKLFVLFLAMIGQAYLQQALKPWIALHQSSLPAALVELSDLICRPHGSSYLIDDPPANAQELVRALKLPCYRRQ